MKLASLANGRPDGQLVVVSTDLTLAAPADHIAPNLLNAIERWDDVEADLRELSAAVAAGTAAQLAPLAMDRLVAPLPRTWQWLDGSVYKTHVDLGTAAYGIPDVWYDGPLMYQGMSHQFLPPIGEVPFPRADDGVDFEGEFGVVLRAVPMGATVEQARQSIILLTQINDWSLRSFGRDEMQRGYGWILTKPACTLAPIMVTPDELEDAWRDCRCALNLNIHRNDELFGQANGVEMAFGFDELIVHAAYSRALPAGTIIGSGTVANADYRRAGSSCILERRAIEMIDHGEMRTAFLRDGERVRMAAIDANGDMPFGMSDSVIRIVG
nr:fumarylacetoacetate hydrolase family protein [Sphingomonas sp. Y57]